MREQLALLPEYLTAHLQLSLVALALGVGISVPLGVWLTRRTRFEGPVLGLASVIQTIPSLALLAVMVPILTTIGAAVSRFGIDLRGIGYTPALIALTLYSLLPILRNTVTGLAGVDAACVEAARAVGMTQRQRLFQVELPLALPVLVAGIRTAAVWVIGTATLSTPIGATSLGNYIFSGLATRNDAAILVGCIAAAGLALSIDTIIRGIEHGTREGHRGLQLAAGGALAGLVLYTLTSFATSGSGGCPRDAIKIGSKAFTEQYILAEILAQQIRDETGRKTCLLPSLGSSVAFDALANHDIDTYVDYTGTIWATVMNESQFPKDRSSVLTRVQQFLTREHKIELAAALGFENTYALGMRASDARARNLRRISDLGAVSPSLEIGGDYEFFDRTEWHTLEERYGLAFAKERSMDPSLMYRAVSEGEVDVIAAYSTDGRIAANDLMLLVDDRRVIPPYDAVVLVGKRTHARAPDVTHALRELSNRLDSAAMQRLNHRVDTDAISPAAAAAEFFAASP